VHIWLQTHKKILRIQQHPASAFTASLKKIHMDRTGTDEQNITSKHRSTTPCMHP
jgi:hypothetical protein